ncbi:tether containing UBX domain for GLUT4 [Anastrepha obliqua]|uniref:tether containing UBX domain for GLUT4 n=1 Tax=Anastrepha obliqua TaxID=95512 RepID=UPI002409EB79|nr:tether containing UBX domain for GLUT4 [Anastrepha obliqua]
MEGKVTVLTPNNRRQNVKVTPNTTILQILEEVCQKHDLDSNEYCLKHHNKEVGLTQMFRFSGLPNNCLLEMSHTERRRTESNVNICVQLEDGSRAQGQFKPNNSLWQVIEQLGAEAIKSYTSPVAIYMRQDIIGKERMQETTLKSLGIIEGRAMIRVINKTAEDLKSQANVYIPPTVKVDENIAATTVAPQNSTVKQSGGGGFAITKDLVQSLKKSNSEINEKSDIKEEITPVDASSMDNETQKPKYDWGSGTGYSIQDSFHAQNTAKNLSDVADQEQDEMDIEPEVHIIGERNAVLYSLDDTQTQAEELPDSFFDLTVEDLRLVLRDLKKVSKGDENSPLLTERLRKLEEQKTMLNKIGQYKNCVLRIQFPDRFVLQGIFKPIDKISDVVDFVRKFLHDEKANFYLFTIPPKYILPLDQSLLELNFVPTAVLHFVFQDKEENANMANKSVEPIYLKSELKDKLTTVEGAFYAANKMRISNARVSKSSANDGSDSLLREQNEQRSADTSMGAIPKKQKNSNLNSMI